MKYVIRLILIIAIGASALAYLDAGIANVTKAQNVSITYIDYVGL